MRRWSLIALVAACASGRDPECATGFEPREDGNCYEVPDTTTDEPVDSADTAEPPLSPEDALDLAFDTLPECELVAGDGALDLTGPSYCAGPGCADMTVTELLAAYGGDGYCAPDGGEVVCVWPTWDVLAYFDDSDGDGAAASDQQAYGFYVGSSFPGATEDGLAPGISVRCFIDEVGTPTELLLVDDYGETWILWWGWDGGEYYLLDAYDGQDPGGDGYAEYIWLNGPG